MQELVTYQSSTPYFAKSFDFALISEKKLGKTNQHIVN